MLLTPPPLRRRALAELCGTAFLLAIVVGSGIAAETLSPGDVGLQLLENAVAGTVVGNLMFELPAFVAAQMVGAVLAVVLIRTLYPDVDDVAGDVVVPQTAIDEPT